MGKVHLMMRSHRVPVLYSSFLLAGVLTAPLSCKSPITDESALDNGQFILDEDLPAYVRVAQVQNDRVSRIAAFWSSAAFTMQWRDDEGATRTEDGEGYLMFIPPSRTGLVFKKLSETYLWLGSDDQRFWLFAGGDDSVGYVGRNQNVFDALAEPLPMTIHPVELIDLLGMFPFPDAESPVGRQLRVERPASLILHTGAGRRVRTPRVRGWLLTVPGPYGDRRVYLDPQTLRPIRVELIDRGSGRVAAWSELSEYKEMYGDSLPPDGFPLVPTRLVFHQGEPFQRDLDEAPNVLRQGDPIAIVTLRQPRDSPASGAWNESMFSFDAVRRRMRPRELVVLDARCKDPALPPVAIELP